MNIINRDILTLEPGWYICHQANCTSSSGRGLAKALFERFPESNIYKWRQYHMFSVPGTIQITPADGQMIVHLMGQYTSGKPTGADTTALREDWFQMSLQKFAEFLHQKWEQDKPKEKFKIAFPWHIGCGLAGGNWDHYMGLLLKFKLLVDEIADVVICKNE